MGKNSVPPVREGEDYIEIDQVKGEWPFLRAQWADTSGKRSLVVIGDCNDATQAINGGQGVSVVLLSKKRARRLRDFLNRTV